MADLSSILNDSTSQLNLSLVHWVIRRALSRDKEIHNVDSQVILLFRSDWFFFPEVTIFVFE